MTDDALIEDDVSDELEELEHSESWADGAVLWSTDWTAETVFTQLERGNIDLNPSFQRRNAWTPKKQALFIESLIIGLPIPQLILAEDRNKKGSFIVIDGKQRLLSIRMFVSGPNSEFTPLKLKGLGVRTDLNNKSYHDMLASPDLSDDLAAFQNSSIRAVVIRNWKSDSYLYEVFLRINSGSVQLSPQELRQALHPGEFSKFIDDRSSESNGLRNALNLTEPDFRMRDAEILLRYLAYRNFAEEYAGNLKQFLDTTTRRFNDEWPTKMARVEGQVAEMEEAFTFTEKAFGPEFYLRKWNGEQFERRKNRAVFDIMLQFFSEARIREALIGKEKVLVDEFKRLCEKDMEFLASIERTTKTNEANHIRFNRWRESLCSLTGLDITPIKFR